MTRSVSALQSRYMQRVGNSNTFRNTARDPSNGFAINENVGAVARQIGGGLPGGEAKVQVRNGQRYWHRVAYGSAGTAGTISFFNVAKTPYVTNFPQAASLPANFAFMLSSICFKLYQGIDITGARVAGGAASSVSSGAPLTLAEEMRTILENGVVNFAISDRPVLDNIYGLDAFPSGRGIDVQPTIATTAGTTTTGAAISNNGAPLWANRMTWGTPYPILAGQSLRLDVTWQNALSMTGGGVLMAELVGDLVLPATL
jgi:hypothetical protein